MYSVLENCGTGKLTMLRITVRRCWVECGNQPLSTAPMASRNREFVEVLRGTTSVMVLVSIPIPNTPMPLDVPVGTS